jgi:CRISPR-associated endonuclease Csn1
MIETKNVLALDLGPTSIGWALIDEANARITAAGVCVFPEGVDRDQRGVEKSKNRQRREARAIRRQIARRSKRIRTLREALVGLGWLPAAANRPARDPDRRDWEEAEFRNADPYQLRRKALDEKLELHELGRALLHLARHRGFLSNRKTDRRKKSETSEMLEKITELQAKVESSGSRTVGEYFAKLMDIEPLGRVRGVHTRRDMLLTEFEMIWESQRRFYPDVLTDELKYGSHQAAITYPATPEPRWKSRQSRLARFGIHGLLFFQRAMYWPKSVVGRCEIDPKQPRCPRADRVAQECRMLQEVNNLRIISETGEILPLTEEQREQAIDQLSRKGDMALEKLRKALKLHEQARFNLEAGDRKTIHGLATDAVMGGKKLFGKAWEGMPEERKNAIVRGLLADDEAAFRKQASTWGIDAELTEKLLDVNLPEGYASYGQRTLEALLPHLRAGLPLTAAEGVRSALREAGFLAPWERPRKQGESLPAPPKITNPIVRQGLFMVRKLVNAVVAEYGRPDAIHIELAREVKGNADQRANAAKEMRRREQLRKEAADVIKEHGVKVTKDAIDRYLLWKEQREQCFYSGKSISLHQLFGGEVDVDHLLPYSQSLDNSLANKVVCFRSENQAKGQQTVHAWLAAVDPEKYDKVLQRAWRLPEDVRLPKLRRITRADCNIEEFISRQLVDTAYITRMVHEYLKFLTPNVVATKGACTAELRHQWGLNDILRDDGLNLKSREDHRHHAIDAVVIGLTTRARLQLLARNRGRQPITPPWENFRNHVAEVINGINVWHKPAGRVRGKLHEETLYGATQKYPPSEQRPRLWAKGWVEADGVYVLRKPLEALSPAEVERIRDVRVREVVMQRLQEHGITVGRKKRGEPTAGSTIPKEVWREPLLLTPRNGRGAATPIKRVRITKNEDSVVPLRDLGRTCVKPGNLHHVAIFETGVSKGKPKRVAVFVSMLEAVQRKRSKLPVVQRQHPDFPEARFIMALCRGETVLGLFKGRKRLMRFLTAASTQGQIYFAGHEDARPSGTIGKLAVNANTLSGQKVVVDLLGRIHPAR